MNSVNDLEFMMKALEVGKEARLHSSPNPWVGSIVVSNGEVISKAATGPPGEPHAEAQALLEAGEKAQGATLYTTLEPCSHFGKTGPCTEAIINAQISRVVVAIKDPDEQVLGSGIRTLLDAGIEVELGPGATEVLEQLAPYLCHRNTGRPYVVLKLAATLDGRIAAPDGSSVWITGEEARADVHQLRAESDAVCVGAGTVRSDDPQLTVRAVEGTDPRRIVVGEIPEGALVQPAESWTGDLKELLNSLGNQGVLQLLVEGGADVAGRFHREGLVNRYVVYLAPAFLGGDDGKALFTGSGAPTMEQIQRGRFTSITQLGNDVRVDLILEES